MISNAYMIRSDGKAIPCTQHIYASVDSIDETLYAAEWLYDNTNHFEVKELIEEFVVSVGIRLKQRYNTKTIQAAYIKDIDSKPYKFISKQFINRLTDKIVDVSKNISVEEYVTKIANELNQEFLRARFGGIYNTSVNSKEMVFRISSIGFNWYNIIYEFVAKHSSEIKEVTIVRDEESTGNSGFYKTYDGKQYYNQLPIEEILTESGNPVIEKLCKTKGNPKSSSIMSVMLTSLSEGSSITSCYELPFNSHRVTRYLSMIELSENNRTHGDYLKERLQ